MGKTLTSACRLTSETTFSKIWWVHLVFCWSIIDIWSCKLTFTDIREFFCISVIFIGEMNF